MREWDTLFSAGANINSDNEIYIIEKYTSI